MKKFILSLLVCFVSLVSFSSATVFPSVEEILPNNGFQNITPIPSISCRGNGSVYLQFDGVGGKGQSYTLQCPGTFDSFRGSTVSINAYYSPYSGNPVVYVNSTSTPSSVFGSVFTGLTNSINEFIPYVVYIGLGVLGVLILFVAIKRLINWIRIKVLSPFK